MPELVLVRLAHERTYAGQVYIMFGCAGLECGSLPKHVSYVYAAGTSGETSMLEAKLDEVVQMLQAKHWFPTIADQAWSEQLSL